MLLRKASQLDIGDIIDVSDKGYWCVESVGPHDAIGSVLTVVLSNRGIDSCPPVELRRMTVLRDDYLPVSIKLQKL